MTLRDYQCPAVRALVQARRGIVKAPAGSGKTIVGAAALCQWSIPRAKLWGRRPKVAWVANTLEQIDQAKAAIERFPAIAQSAEVTTACYASGIALAQFDLVICDECHHAAAPEARTMLEGHEGARWGLSATPERADDLKESVFALIGPIIHEVPRESLVTAGQLAKAKVTIHQPNQKNELDGAIMAQAMPVFHERMRRYGRFVSHDEQRNRCIWQAALELGIIANAKRNAKIIDLATKHAQEATLIIIGNIEHGEALSSRIAGSQVVHSKMGAKRRRLALAAFAERQLPCAIATSLADEGLDLPMANVLILAAAGRSAAKAEQRTGRVLRAYQDKTHGQIHDFMDVGHYFLLAQSNRRIALYRSLGYEVAFANPFSP